MRNQLDERSWRLMVFRMLHYSGSPLIVRGRAARQPGAGGDDHQMAGAGARARTASSDSCEVFPRAHGPATNVVVTEYELPHVLLAAHDVSGDSKGNIWYSSHRTPFMGKLDPQDRHRHRVSGAGDAARRPSRHPPHAGRQERHRLGLGELGAQSRCGFDPASGTFTDHPADAGDEPLNTPGLGNFSIGPTAAFWFARNKAVQKFDSKTGKLLERVPFTATNQCQPVRQHHHRRREFLGRRLRRPAAATPSS